MTSARIPLPEPFDLALSEFYRTQPQMQLYKKFVRIGAMLGDPLAQYAMATWYLHGNSDIGIKKNARTAVQLLETCAPVFNRAAYDLAVCKFRGIGTKRDLNAAFLLFVRATNLGSLPAMEEQARCLATGTGTKRDLKAARFLLQRVAHWKEEVRRAKPTRSRLLTSRKQRMSTHARVSRRADPTRRQRAVQRPGGPVRG
jgi:uncharacterized protein